MVSIGMATTSDCHAWSMKESGRNLFVSRLLRRIRHVCDVDVHIYSKSNGVCLEGGMNLNCSGYHPVVDFMHIYEHCLTKLRTI